MIDTTKIVKRRKLYSDDDLKDAINAVKNGQTQNVVCDLFGIPERTLHDKCVYHYFHYFLFFLYLF